MGFNAASQVEPLDWDFTTLQHRPAVLEGAKGVMAEPTSDQVDEFLTRYQELLVMLNSIEQSGGEVERFTPAGWENLTVAEKIAQWETYSPVKTEEKEQLRKVLIDLLMVICRSEGGPTREMLEALPHRVRTAFYQWLVQEFVIPKGLPMASQAIG